jgi:hypothetical protein
MSLLNQICRQVTKEIDGVPSKVCSGGMSLPPDIIHHITFEYLFPQSNLWYVPWDLQQDICLLREEGRRSCLSTFITSHQGPLKIEWKLPLKEGETEEDQHFITVSTDIRNLEKTGLLHKNANPLTRNRFQAVELEGDSSIRAIGEDYSKEIRDLEDRVNLNKVQILNKMRSVECPLLLKDDHDNIHPGSDMGDYPLESYPDSMVLKEMDEEDLRQRGVGCSLKKTRMSDMEKLNNALDLIIDNGMCDETMIDENILSGRLARNHTAPSGILWCPLIGLGINGKHGGDRIEFTYDTI